VISLSVQAVFHLMTGLERSIQKISRSRRCCSIIKMSSVFQPSRKTILTMRYNYLYSEKELKEFVAPIKDVARRAETTFVFFNNCHAGKAMKNAQMMKEMLNETGS